jgi:hypothetical protein
MFDQNHYVPILRWKRGEYGALRLLSDTEKLRLTPLIEFPPGMFSSPENDNDFRGTLIRAASDIHKAWGARRAFCDLGLMPPAAEAAGIGHPVSLLWEYARRHHLNLVPVIALRASGRYQAAAARVIDRDNGGACIRVTSEQLHSTTFGRDLADLMASCRVTPATVDLVIDRRIVTTMSVPTQQLLHRLPTIGEWRTLTVAGGAFPRDLREFSVGQHLHPRLEWQMWRQAGTAERVQRRVTFADYTTQHAIFAEPPRRANFSASIRYTSNDHWVIMRGEGVFNDDSAGFAQWPANAMLLCERPEFCGAQFSAGDAYIASRTVVGASTGNAEWWLRASINHHMTFVIRQIANLTD